MLCEPVYLGFCSGDVIIVPDHYLRISWAVGNASEGDTIFVRSGSYVESEILVNKNLTIIGENAENTIIDGESTAGHIFHITATHVVIENFTMKNTNPDPFSYSYAIQIYNATEVTVKNFIIANVVIGIEIRSSNHTEVMYGRISRSVTWGVRIRDASCNNTIVGNTFENNPTALYFADDKSKFSKVYHNNFVNNTNQVILSAINYFHNGYLVGGNYWSDHIATDLKYGPYQNETGSDGILDEGYPAGSDTPLDRYPLAHPLTSFEVVADGENFEVEVSTNSSFNSYNFDREAKSLTLFLNGTEGTNGSCRVSIPKRLLSCESLSEWNVALYDGEQIPYLALGDEDRTYLHFAYNHSSIVEIEIKGTIVIPEFPSATVLIGLLSTVTLAIAVVKAKLLKMKKMN